jgi:hypothetical protein
MRKLLGIGLAMGIGAGLAATIISRAGAESEEAKLRTLVPKIIGSWESLDITKIEPNYAADADFAYFDLVPMNTTTGRSTARVCRRRFLNQIAASSCG